MEQQKYIVIEYGSPYNSAELKIYKPDTLSVMKEYWRYCFAFDEYNKYGLVLDHIPKLSIIEKILAHTLYNPNVNLQSRWESLGKYSLSEIDDLIKMGLEKDDDIIQQWFSADDVIKLLDNAKSWKKKMLAIAAICGGHESDAETLRYVEEIIR